MEEERGRFSRDEAYRETRFIKLIENNLSAGDATPARRRGVVDYDDVSKLTRPPAFDWWVKVHLSHQDLAGMEVSDAPTGSRMEKESNSGLK